MLPEQTVRYLSKFAQRQKKSYFSPQKWSNFLIFNENVSLGAEQYTFYTDIFLGLFLAFLDQIRLFLGQLKLKILKVYLYMLGTSISSFLIR